MAGMIFTKLDQLISFNQTLVALYQSLTHDLERKVSWAVQRGMIPCFFTARGIWSAK